MVGTHVPSFPHRRRVPAAELIRVPPVLLLDHHARLVTLIPRSIVVVIGGVRYSQYQKLLKLMTALRDPIEHFPGKMFLHAPREMLESDPPPFR
jgi:hypothetical protein